MASPFEVSKALRKLALLGAASLPQLLRDQKLGMEISEAFMIAAETIDELVRENEKLRRTS